MRTNNLTIFKHLNVVVFIKWFYLDDSSEQFFGHDFHHDFHYAHLSSSSRFKLVAKKDTNDYALQSRIGFEHTLVLSNTKCNY